MTDLLLPFYLWIKAFHVIAVVSWMAGLLYLPRLFVNHCEAEPGSSLKTYDVYATMEAYLRLHFPPKKTIRFLCKSHHRKLHRCEKESRKSVQAFKRKVSWL